jgi:hypothetical protein
MENQEALSIMRALASGLDPESGKKLDDRSVCRRPQVIKALNRSLAALLQLQQREERRPTQAGQYWSREEDAQICAEVRRGIDFNEIAKSHRRSVPSIAARLIKLGEVKPGSSRSARRTGPTLNLEIGPLAR